MRTNNSTCEICGNPFYIQPSVKAKGNGRFCSRSCHMAARKAASGSYKTCEHCGQQFFAKHIDTAKGRGRFCSVTCMRSFFKVERTPNATCLHCGTPFYASKGNIKLGWGKYCSTKCRDAHMTVIAHSEARIAERFWAKVNKDGPIHPELKTRCWLWTGQLDPAGYGHFSLKGVQELAHRVAYELTNGSVPEKHFTLHKCDNPPCIRPDHLFTGEHLDNMNDMVMKGRHAHGEKHGNAKLTDKLVREIRERYLTETPNRSSLAQEYGVTRGTIWYIVKGKGWKHVV